jgi:hypothetical protein
MKECPEKIGGAKVILYTFIDNTHKFTGKCKQIVGGQLRGPMAGLAICQYEGEDSVYLFGCGEDWQAVTDTWHQTLEEAIDQAEFEYEGTKTSWIRK